MRSLWQSLAGTGLGGSSSWQRHFIWSCFRGLWLKLCWGDCLVGLWLELDWEGCLWLGLGYEGCILDAITSTYIYWGNTMALYTGMVILVLSNTRPPAAFMVWVKYSVMYRNGGKIMQVKHADWKNWQTLQTQELNSKNRKWLGYFQTA